MGSIVELLRKLAKPFVWLVLVILDPVLGPLSIALHQQQLNYDKTSKKYLLEPANLSMDETSKKYWRKPASLLASDAEWHLIYTTFENWGFDFIDTFEEYSKEGLINNWPRFWIGSEDDENKRITFDRVGDKWKPRTIPPLAEGGEKERVDG